MVGVPPTGRPSVTTTPENNRPVVSHASISKASETPKSLKAAVSEVAPSGGEYPPRKKEALEVTSSSSQAASSIKVGASDLLPAAPPLDSASVPPQLQPPPRVVLRERSVPSTPLARVLGFGTRCQCWQRIINRSFLVSVMGHGR